MLDDWEWSLKETLRTLTGLGGTIRKGIPDQEFFVSFFCIDYFEYLPAKVLLDSTPSLSSAEKLLRLCVGDMLGVGWITLMSI